MKHLIVLIITALIALPSISQTGTDSSKIANKHLRAAIKEIEAGDICKEEKKVLLQKVDSANAIISIQDSTISKFKKKESAYKSIIVDYAKADSILNEKAQTYFDLYNTSQLNLAAQTKKTKRAYIYSGIGFILAFFALK